MSLKNKKTVLDHALEYHSQGWCIIPIRAGTKKPAVRSWKQYQSVRPDVAQLKKWFGNGDKSIAVVLGEVSNDLVCRDFDTMQEYEQWAQKYADLAKLLPTVRTANGMHVYFEAKIEGIKHIENGELRGKGGCCLLPPSVHPDGQVYEWVNPLTNGNLLVVDPERAGFLTTNNDVTERAERTDENLGELKEIVVCKSIEEAIKRTLPKDIHTRHRKIFDFARCLKSMPEYTEADPKEFRSAVEQWHKRALPNIETKEFEETWIDFLKGWKKIKWKIGESPMAQIFEEVQKLEPPQKAVEKYPNNKNLQLLVSLCRELYRKSKPNPFFLTVRAGAGFFNVVPMTISRWLFLLETDEFIRTIEKGGTKENPRKATRFRYIGD